MEKKIVFTPVEPNKNLLWLHYKNGLLVLQRFGSKGWEDITNSDQITEAEVRELIKDKANLVGGKVPAEELPSYVDDVIEFDNIQVADAEISSIIGNNLYKNQIRFVNNSTTLPDRIGSEDKYPNMFVNFGENTSEDDWTTFEPEEGKIYVNTTNNHSYRWSGSYLIDLDSNWSQGIKYLQENTIRTDTPQSFSASRLVQAFANLGMKVYVTDSSFLGSTLSAEEIEEVFVSKAILFTDTGDLFSFGAASSLQIYFYKFINRFSIGYITLNKPSGLVSNGSFSYQDTSALHFTVENPALTSAQQDVALSNIGLNWIHVPYSLLNTTLSDGMANAINNAQGIILVDTPNDFILPTIYNKGRTTSASAKFIAIGEVKDVYYISYNKNTKALAAIVHDYTDNGCVRYIQNQSLTNTQKDTVLSNIGLKWVNVPYSLLNTTLDDATYAKIKNANGLILTDAPSEYYGPLEFICGANNSDGVKVFTNLNLADTSAYIILYTNHSLTNVRYLRTYNGAVPYDASKTLTSDQQDVALSNIGLNFVHVDYSLLGTTLTDAQAQSIVNSRGIILTNVPESSVIPTVYLKGLNDNNYCYFLTINGNTIISQISFNKGTKALSNSLNTDLHFDSVRYNVTQTLTNTQKQQARTNIGVKSADELLEDADFIAQLKTKLETA